MLRRRPKARTRVFRRAMAAVSKHEAPRPHPSRRAHARPDLRQPYRTRAPQDEDGRAHAEAAQRIPSSRLVAEPGAAVAKHEGPVPPSLFPSCRGAARSAASRGTRAVLILRDARTLVRVRGTASAGALLRMRTAELAARRRTVRGHSISRCQTAQTSLSRGAFAASGFCHLTFTHPRIEGWAERRRAHLLSLSRR